jgi:glycosyltransferase involved in cell wall biosynthesis
VSSRERDPLRLAILGYAGSLHVRRWVDFLTQRGHDVHLVTCGGSESVTELDAERVHDLGIPRGGKLGYVAKVVPARAIVRRLRPDVVHVHTATSYGLLGLAGGARPLVLTAHGSDLLRTPRNPFIRPVVRRVLRAAALVTVPSEPMRKAALALAAPAKPRLEVFQYGVESERLARLAARWRNGESTGAEVRIVSARPLEPLYHVDALVSAVPHLRASGSSVRLDVYGQGSRRDLLQRRARDEGVADIVSFHGNRPPEEVEEALARADIYVSVSESDGVSIALLEAMALGAVPVVSAIEANRLWIDDGVNGVLVTVDPVAIADGIERARTLDPGAVARRNAELVRARADRFTALLRFESLLYEVVGS